MADDKTQLTRLRCTRCDGRGEKWVTHTITCHQETRRLASEEWEKIGAQPATLNEVLVAANEAAKEGGSTFGMWLMGGQAGLPIAQKILAMRGLPTGEPEIVDTLGEQPQDAEGPR